MAKRKRNNRRRTGRRSSATQRNTLRTVNRAIHFKPVRTRINQDPPSISRTLSGSVTFPILISVKTKGDPTTGFEVGSTDKYSYIQLGRNDSGSLNAAAFRASNVMDALVAWMQWKNDDGRFRTSFAIRKVSLWGPNPYTGAPHYRDAEIGLRVDLGDISNALELHDCGTTTRRACVAASIPYSIWMESMDQVVIAIYPDAAEQTCDIGDGAIWGRLHISVDWRRGPSTLFVGKRANIKEAVPPLTSSDTRSSAQSAGEGGKRRR